MGLQGQPLAILDEDRRFLFAIDRLKLAGTMKIALAERGTEPELAIGIQISRREADEAARLDDEEVRVVPGTARLEFKLVQVDSVPCNTPRRPGIQFLPSDELPAGTCIGVSSRAMISGEQIADANQNYDDQNRVAVQVRFNVRPEVTLFELQRAE